MKAAVYQGNQKLVIEDLPVPEPGPGEILVKISHSAICGTDVHAFLYDIAPSGAVMGHEFSGTVAAVGPDRNVYPWSGMDVVLAGRDLGSPSSGIRDQRRFS